MRISMPCVLTRAEARKRLSNLDSERHTGHAHATSGTPLDVPLPRIVTSIEVSIKFTSGLSTIPNCSLTFRTIRRDRSVTSFSRGASGIGNHKALLRVNFRASDAVSFHSGMFYEPSGRNFHFVVAEWVGGNVRFRASIISSKKYLLTSGF